MDQRIAVKLQEQAEERMVDRLDWRGVTDHGELRMWADKFVRDVAIEDVPEAGEEEIVFVTGCMTAIAGLNNSDWVGFVRKMRPGLCALVDRVSRGEMSDAEALASLKDVDPDVLLFKELMKTSGLATEP